VRPAPAGPRPATISSLRQYGKVHQLTAYGSVFNAENLIKVARLEGAKGHRGIYDGHVITTTDPNDHVKKVKGLIDQECPVIVPFDVGLGGEPDHEGKGKAAHWAAIFGYYRDGPTDYFIHYYWGFCLGSAGTGPSGLGRMVPLAEWQSAARVHRPRLGASGAPPWHPPTS